MNIFKEAIEKSKAFLFRRQQAYLLTFNKESFHTQAVLRDLAKFCRATETTFHPDARIHAALEGRREVWMRIQNHLNLDSETIWKTYGRKDLE